MERSAAFGTPFFFFLFVPLRTLHVRGHGGEAAGQALGQRGEGSAEPGQQVLMSSAFFFFFFSFVRCERVRWLDVDPCDWCV